MTDLAACEFEPGSASRVMLGRESGGMIIYDLEAQKPSAKVLLCCACKLYLYSDACRPLSLYKQSRALHVSMHHINLRCMALHCTVCAALCIIAETYHTFAVHINRARLGLWAPLPESECHILTCIQKRLIKSMRTNIRRSGIYCLRDSS